MKVLILASNPRNDLGLNQEIRELKAVIDSSHNRQEFEVKDASAVRVGDLQELLLKHQPQIVHFCGHGGGQAGLVFEGKNGGEQWVRTEALRDLFRLFSSTVGCVLLNACYSDEQANEIVNHIDYVIGMNQTIRDDAAIAFAKGFYRALGYNCSIEEAYEFGCNAIQLEISGSSISRGPAVERKLNAENIVTSKVISEHLKPTLKKSTQVNGSSRWRESATKPPPLSHKERVELQQDVVRAVTGFGANTNTSDHPQRLSLSTPAAPPLPSPKSRRFSPLFLGGIVACVIPAIGFYGYQQWQKQPPVQVISPPPVQKDPPGWQDYKYAWLSQRPVTETDLKGKSTTELDVMRNSVYAKYGFTFGDDTLKSTFLKESWYKPTRNGAAVEKLLSPLEIYNAVTIRDFPKKIASPPPAPIVSPPSVQKDPPGWQDYKYAWLSQRPVTETDLKGKSTTELEVMRNSISAKYGSIFGDDTLKSTFLKESWYKPTRNKSEVEKLLSQLEKDNAVKISDFQKQKSKQDLVNFT